MDFQGRSIRPFEHLEILKRATGGSPCLSSVICHLSSEPRSFGAWLEPRYIFGAGQLFDQ